MKKANRRAQYGKRILVTLSRELMTEFGKGFDISNLGYMRQFRQSLFERTILHPPKVAPAARQIHCEAAIGVFKDDAYVPSLRGFSNSERGAYRIELDGLPNG